MYTVIPKQFRLSTRHWTDIHVNWIVKNPKRLPDQADFYQTMASVRQIFGIIVYKSINYQCI